MEEIWHDIRFKYRVIFDYNQVDNIAILQWVESNIGYHTTDWVWWTPGPVSYFYCKTEENKVKFALRWA